MKLKPYYRLSDFPDRKGLGKNWMATCPLCDKKHLSISKENGLFHCFSPDCDFNGQLDDFKPYPYQHNALGVRNCDTDVNLSVLKVKGSGLKVNGSHPDLNRNFQSIKDFPDRVKISCQRQLKKHLVATREILKALPEIL